MNFKKFISTGLAALMVVSTVASAAPTSVSAATIDKTDFSAFTAAGASVPNISAKQAYTLNIDKANGAFNVTPSGHKSMPISAAEKELLKAESIPTSYMNTEAKVSAQFPATRNQAPYGTCWAFSSVAMAEISMIKKGKANKTVDYSELQLAYFTYHSAIDPLGGTTGDVNSFNYPNGYLQMGGNRYASSRIMSSWQGIANESDVPYSKAGNYINGKLDSKYAYSYNKAVLNNSYIVLKEDDSYITDMKKIIMKTGSAGIGYCAGFDNLVGTTKYQGQTVSTYYDPDKDGSNHAVTVVGWDDNFPASAFEVTIGGYKYKPAKNGGWLVRNSWTTDPKSTAGDAYFWLSYYEGSLDKVIWGFDMVPANTYGSNYQYDGGYFVEPLEALSVNGDPVYLQAAGNIFTAKKAETITAVMLSETDVDNDEYLISIFKNVPDNNPTGGELVYQQEGKNTYSGQYTVDLAKPVSISAGTKFSIVVQFGSGMYDIEVDENANKADEGYVSDVTPSGHSFIVLSNTWYSTTAISHLGYGDVSIKALTKGTTSHTHSYAAPTFTWAKDYKSCVAVSKCSCGATQKVNCTVKASTVKAATYFEKGKTTYTATVSIGGKTYTDKKTVDTAVKTLAKVSLSSVKSAKAKQLTIKWKKNANATGYEVQYSTKSNFKGAKTVTIKSAKTVTTTVKKLKSKSKYYVRIRAYKTGKVGGKTKKVTSAWSSAKNAKIK